MGHVRDICPLPDHGNNQNHALWVLGQLHHDGGLKRHRPDLWHVGRAGLIFLLGPNMCDFPVHVTRPVVSQKLWDNGVIKPTR